MRTELYGSMFGRMGLLRLSRNSLLFFVAVVLIPMTISCSGEDYNALIEEEVSFYNSKNPGVAIFSPADGDYIQTLDKDRDGVIIDKSLILRGGAKYENGDPIENENAYTWSSDRDGVLGTGRELVISTRLSGGMHDITLRVIDLTGAENSAAISFHFPDVYFDNFTTAEYRDSSKTTGAWDTGVATRGAHLGPCRKYESIGEYKYSGIVSSVKISDQYAYIANLNNKFEVVDISNQEQPVLTGSCNTGNAIYNLTLSGSFAYVAQGDKGLAIIDVSSPVSPVVKGSTITSGQVWSVAVSGAYAYVADGDKGLTIIDITDPDNPSVKGTNNTINYSASSVAVSGSNVYMLYEYFGLVIFDVSNPEAPSIKSTTPLAYPYDMAISGSLLYVTSDYGSLTILDVSNPLSPVEKGFYNHPYKTIHSRIAVSGNSAYMTSRIDGLIDFDISNPAQPSIKGTYKTTGQIYDVAVSGDHAYVTVADHGMIVVNTVNVATPSLKSTSRAGYSNYAVALAGNYAFLADYYHLAIVDVSNPASPVTAGERHSDKATCVTMSGQYVYVSNYDYGFTIYDVSNPALPGLVKHVYTPGTAWGIAVSGNYAYVADQSNGMLIYDVTDPADPVAMGSFGSINAMSVAIEGNYAYVATIDDGFLVIDVSNPNAPALKGSYGPMGTLFHVALSGDYAYVADWDNGLVIIDKSNPESPFKKGSYQTLGNPRFVALADNYALVADENHGLAVIDVSDPGRPSLAGIYRTTEPVLGVVARDEYYYLASAIAGMEIITRLKPYSEIYSLETQIVQSTAIALKNVSHARFFMEHTPDLRFIEVMELSNTTSDTWMMAGEGAFQQFPAIPGGVLRWRLKLRTDERYETPRVRKVAIEYWE